VFLCNFFNGRVLCDERVLFKNPVELRVLGYFRILALTSVVLIVSMKFLCQNQ
jgi:hypothetical protein